MEAITFKSSQQDTLVINGNEISVTNKFGDTYNGKIGASNNIIGAKSSIALQYLSRAYYEYKRLNNTAFLN